MNANTSIIRFLLNRNGRVHDLDGKQDSIH